MTWGPRAYSGPSCTSVVLGQALTCKPGRLNAFFSPRVYLFTVYMLTHERVESKGHVEVNSLLPQCESWGLNS